MDFKFTFKHLEALDSIKEYAQNRIEKIEKYNLHKEMIVQFIFSVQKADQIAEVKVDAGGQHYTAIAKDPTLYNAIDQVVEKLEHQLLKHKDKVQHHHSFDKSNEGFLKHELTNLARKNHQERERFVKGVKK